MPQIVRIAKSLPHRDWNFYGLISTIEVERHRKENPPIPTWLADSYSAALHDLLRMGVADLPNAEDQVTVHSILGAVALAKGNLKLGALISNSTPSEIDEMLEQYDGWSKYYVQ